MPSQTKAPEKKSKETKKQKSEPVLPELDSQQAAQLSFITDEIARQLSSQPPTLPSPRSRPKLTQKQVNHLQHRVGNQASRRILSLAGKGRVQREPQSQQERRAAEKEAANSPKKDDAEQFEGFTLTPDAAVLERVLKSIIAQKGLKGGATFVMNYSMRGVLTEEQREKKSKIEPILKSKMDELEQTAKKYAENDFYNAATTNLETILADSEKTVKAESEKYGRSYTQVKTGVYKGEEMTRAKPVLTNEQNTAEMATAAKGLLGHQNKMDELNKKRESYEKKVYGYVDTGRDRGYSLPPREVIRTDITDPAAHKQVVEEIKAAQKEYDLARQAAEGKFPILASFRPPQGLGQLKTIAEGKKEDRDSIIIRDIEDKFKNIAEIKDVARDGKFVYKQPTIVQATKRSLGVQAGSIEDKGIDAKVEAVAESEFYRKLALGLVSLIAGALLAIPTGGGSLVAAGAAGAGAGALAASSAITLYEGIREYQIQKAATGTNFDKAKAISQSDPSFFWLAVDIVFAMTDLAAAAKVFTRAVVAIQAVSKMEDAQAAARLAYQNSGLSGVCTEEYFVNAYLKNAGADTAKLKSAAKGLDALKDAANPLTKSLMAGDPEAIKSLVKSHGRWESLISELNAGSPEMKQISTKVQAYRQEKFMTPLEEAGFKTQPGASSHGTSDIDVYSSSDAAKGAGEKLIEAEKKMTKEWGSPSWDVDLRITFYTDLKSRLLVTEELMPMLSEGEKARLLLEQTRLGTQYNMARRLQSAAGNPEAIARIEKEALDAGGNLDEIRKLAQQGEDVNLRNQALLEADNWEAKYRKAKEAYTQSPSDANKAKLKESGIELQKTQMRANFYTKEAIISPGTALDVLKMGKGDGIQVADAMLEWTAMLEHKIAEYGTVTRALREYEPWKYMERIANQAQKAEISDSLLSRLNTLKERAANIVPSEVRSEEWAKQAAHLGGDAKLDAANLRVYRQFQADMNQLASDIRKAEMSKLKTTATWAK